ncbi:MAG: inositol monophosphatase family protein [Pseudomonadota bacterium]
MHPLLNVAIQAARKGGNSLIRSQRRLNELNIESKGLNDFVSEADRQAERAIIDEIRKHYPEHAILAEESGEHPGKDVTWIIDPLDGTTNFIHDLPVYAVSIGVLIDGKLSQAVVYDPDRQELFTASKGDGAQLEGRKIRVSGRRQLIDSLVATGFPYRDHADDRLDHHIKMLRTVLDATAGVRRGGSAALDLAYVAAGRLDAFWEFGLKAWDVAAGALLIREAGGIVSGIDGSESFLHATHILAGTPKIYAGVAQLFMRHHGDWLRQFASANQNNSPGS